ncbi:unnamed protein product [Discosporangium mesarthrocarpum]
MRNTCCLTLFLVGLTGAVTIESGNKAAFCMTQSTLRTSAYPPLSTGVHNLNHLSMRRRTSWVVRCASRRRLHAISARAEDGVGRIGSTLNSSLTSVFGASSGWFLASGAALASGGEGDVMGPRLDGGAAFAVLAIGASFAFLQARIRGAIEARTARRKYEEELRGVKNRNLSGLATEEDVLAAEERMSELVRVEEEARYVEVLGIPFNLVLPEGGGGAPQPGRSAPRGRKRGRSSPPSNRGGAGEDLPGLGREEDERSTSATVKVALLWLVLISQLWLLLVFANDPMVPGGTPFLHD